MPGHFLSDVDYKGVQTPAVIVIAFLFPFPLVLPLLLLLLFRIQDKLKHIEAKIKVK